MIFSSEQFTGDLQNQIMEIVDMEQVETRSDVQGAAFAVALDVAALARCLAECQIYVPDSNVSEGSGGELREKSAKALARFGVEI